MAASVLLELDDGSRHELLPGDQIGRHWSCALQLADPRVSEAHAMVSLRGAHLHLINLRGGLRIDGQLRKDPKLKAGLVAEVAPGLGLRVVEVQVPESVLCLVGEGVDLPLSRAISLEEGAPVVVHGGQRPGAAVQLWTDGMTWYRLVRGTPSEEVTDGDEVVVGAWRGRLVERSLAAASAPETRGGTRAPLTLRAQFQTVHLFVGEQLAVSLSGVAARILHELAELDGPVAWEVVAEMVWQDEPRRAVLRRRWDANLVRIRRALRDHHVRTDLLHSDGCGNVALVRYPGDRWVIED